MKIFDFKNPKHVQILREEIQRVKRILSEGNKFSMDEIWKEMSENERHDAISATRDDEGPDLADRYADSEWDNIPSDIQDGMDLSAYELAKYNVVSKTNLGTIKSYERKGAEYAKLISAYLNKIGRKDVYSLTTKQSYDLLKKIHALSAATGNVNMDKFSEPKTNPYDMPGGRPSMDQRGNKWTGD
jgi:hypothetical protein